MASGVILPIGGGFVQRNPWIPDMGLAAVTDLSGIMVGSLTTVGGVTSAVVDTTKIGTAFFVLDFKDPDGKVIQGWLTSSGDWRTTPYMCLDSPVANAPAATSGVDIVVGVMDGDLPLSDQWVGFGIRYDDAGGSKPIAVAHDIPTDENLPIASGAFSSGDLSATPSLTAAGIFLRFIRTAEGVSAIPPATRSMQLEPNDDYVKRPRFFFRVTVHGTGGNAAMPFQFSAGYQGAFAIA